MNVKDYGEEVVETQVQLSKDEHGMGHVYVFDIGDMRRVCDCGASQDRAGSGWNEPCPLRKTT